MNKLGAIPVNNTWVRWTSVTSVPEDIKNLVLCEGLVPEMSWCKYFVHNNERKYALLEDRSLWYLSIYVVNGDGTSVVTYWAGAPVTNGMSKDICKENRLQFVSEMPPVGGDCASMRACEKVVNGVATCIPWDTIAWAPYLLKVGALVAVGTGVGALATKRNRKKGALLGFAGAAVAVGILAMAKQFVPGYVCEAHNALEL